jgi:hypothetical protein
VNRLLNKHPPPPLGPIAAALALLMAGGAPTAQTATDITGLYYTGLTSSGGLAAAGTQAADWTCHVRLDQRRHLGQRVLRGRGLRDQPLIDFRVRLHAQHERRAVDHGPGRRAQRGGNSPNTGGDFLPGNGNTGSNEGIYIYTLAFTISRHGIGRDRRQQREQQDRDHDDDGGRRPVLGLRQPDGERRLDPDRHRRRHPDGRLEQHDQFALQNYGSGAADNSTFLIGTNYIVVVVDNTNSQTGSSGSTALNASGLLVYQTSAATINGQPVPEVATWLPLLGVLGCYGLVVIRRRQDQLVPVVA